MTKCEKEEMGVESEEEDTEILVNHLEENHEAITIDIIQHETSSDEELSELMSDVHRGWMGNKTKKGQ